MNRRGDLLAFDRSPTPPTIAERPSLQVAHGIELSDPYAWLRAENWQEVLQNPAMLPDDIKAALDAENSYTDAVLAPLADLRQALLAEMRGRIKEDDAEVPIPDGPFTYYTRHRAGGQHELVCRRPREGGAEQLLLDGDALAAQRLFFEIGDAQISPNHRLLAWSFDDRGSELYAMRVRNLETGTDLPDSVTQCDGHAVWSADASGFFYVKVDNNHRPCRVFYHALGMSADGDRLILDEPDPGLFVSIRATRSKRFGIIAVHDHDSSESYIVDLARPETAAILVEPRRPGCRYQVDHSGDSFFILTNADGAEDFKIVQTPIASPGRGPTGTISCRIGRAG